MYFVLYEIVEESLNAAQNLILKVFIFMGLRTLQAVVKNYWALSAFLYNFIGRPPGGFLLLLSLEKCKAI